jgi:hypothetical protein
VCPRFKSSQMVNGVLSVASLPQAVLSYVAEDWRA